MGSSVVILVLAVSRHVVGLRGSAAGHGVLHGRWRHEATYTFAASLGRLVNPDTCESADLSPTSSLPLATGTIWDAKLLITLFTSKDHSIYFVIALCIHVDRWDMFSQLDATKCQVLIS